MNLSRILGVIILGLTSNQMIAHNGGGHEHIHQLNTNYSLYSICKDDIEGYARKLSGGEYIYPSVREDVEQALISRASTGKMAFEILTGKVPEDHSGGEVSFFFYSNIDLNLREPYDVSINDKSLLTFVANEDGSLRIADNPGSGKAEYILIERDNNGDGVGAFRLTVPVGLIQKGAQAKLTVRGHQMGSNSWFMIFKATDVIQRLKVSAQTEVSFSINQMDDLLLIDAPGHLAGKPVHVVCDGKTSEKVEFRMQGELAKASVKIKPPRKSFTLFYGGDSFQVSFPNEDGISSKTEIIGTYFYYHITRAEKGWQATLTKLYRPSFYNAYNDFFDKRYEDGQVSILNSSHQDIAWVDRPEVCMILRDTLLLTPILEAAFERTDYGFDIEDGLMLREYLDRHPESRDRLATLLNKKLISVGASYNCPYEDMYDAEDQVRQLYLGKKWVKKTFGGYDSKVYWNVDVPGKTLQYPQILKKAGVDYMVISRHAKGIFHWQSPDGSSVFTYSPGHYGSDLLQLSKDMGSKIKYGAEQVVFWDQYYGNGRNHTPMLSDQDMLPAIDYSDFISTWNNFKSIKDEEGKEKEVYFPPMELMTADEFLPLAEKNATHADTIVGERPNVWVYIHGPAHHEAITASREGSKLLPAAEKFLSVANALDPLRMPYPFQELDQAWQAKIYPDHGWGGHDGDITDDLFKEQLVSSRSMAEKLLNKGTDFIASKVKTDESIGIPVVVFNSLSWERTDPVSVTINLPKGKATNLGVVSSEKRGVDSQIASAEYYNDGSIKSADLVFVAEDIPSIGYKTYYLRLLRSTIKAGKDVSVSTYENEFYVITFTQGGISQIYDKELKRDLLNTDRFLGAEVFTMQSVGNGAGEFGDIQQPFMKDFDKVSAYSPDWKILTTGDVYTTYRIRQQVLHAMVEQDVTVYHKLKRVLFETKLLNWTGELYREFRTAFPLALENPLITYEVPFGKVRVGLDEIKTAGERYTPLCKDVHPRSILDWISASDSELTVTLSSSVAAADWIDPTAENDDVILQHLLLASRTSCHWEGNEYSQAGSHYFHNVLTSHRTGDAAGEKMAKQHNEPLLVIVYPVKAIDASLPEYLSFLSIDQENVIVTALKKAEDEERFIVRMYDYAGKTGSVKLGSFFEVGEIHHTNIIEEDPTPVSEMQITKFGIETYSIDLKPTKAGSSDTL